MFLKQKSELDSLRNKPISSSCLNCITLGNKVSTLSLELNKMNQSSKSVSKIINDQRLSMDQRGLGYAKGIALKKQKKLERKIDSLTTLVTQLAMNQQKQPIARVCGICTSPDHYSDVCPSLLEPRTTDHPEAYAANIYNNRPNQQQQNYDPSSSRYNPGVQKFWKPRLIERFSLERERCIWEGEILGYTGGFSPERELYHPGEK
ncbi:hypothetical protein Lal_00039646 [Lupinus albus]|nr:hypothetical protein Lal_00039646 [Lupinus albus]